jgi:hypothetical protein
MKNLNEHLLLIELNLLMGEQFFDDYDDNDTSYWFRTDFSMFYESKYPWRFVMGQIEATDRLEDIRDELLKIEGVSE